MQESTYISFYKAILCHFVLGSKFHFHTQLITRNLNLFGFNFKEEVNINFFHSLEFFRTGCP